MKVILKLWLICYYSLVIVTSLIFVVSDAAAQTLIVRHAPIPIIAPANVSNSVVRRTLSLTFTPSVQAPKSQALPALATPCAPVWQQYLDRGHCYWPEVRPRSDFRVRL